MDCRKHLLLCFIHQKSIGNKILLDIRKIIENRALFKSMPLVTNVTFHTISELVDVLGDFVETGLKHIHTNDLLLLESIRDYKRHKRIMYINLNSIDTTCCRLFLLLLE